MNSYSERDIEMYLTGRRDQQRLFMKEREIRIALRKGREAIEGLYSDFVTAQFKGAFRTKECQAVAESPLREKKSFIGVPFLAFAIFAAVLFFGWVYDASAEKQSVAMQEIEAPREMTAEDYFYDPLRGTPHEGKDLAELENEYYSPEEQ